MPIPADCPHSAHFVFQGKLKAEMAAQVGSWKISLNAAIISTLAFILAFALILPFTFEDNNFYASDEATQWFVWVAITIAAYLYHYDHLIRQRRKRRQIQAKSTV